MSEPSATSGRVGAHGGRRAALRLVGHGAALLAVAVLASTITAATVSAAHGSFSDVPDSHAFFDDIEAVAGACIAGGYQDGTYRPAAPVTRQAMAAFLHRTASKAALGTKVGGLNPTFGQAAPGASPVVPVAEVEVTVPDLPGFCMVPVEVHGQLSATLQGTTAEACTSSGCQMRAMITKDGVAASSSVLIDAMVHTNQVAHFEPSYLFLQPDGTTATYAVAAQGWNLDVGGGATNPSRDVFAVAHPMDATPGAME